MLTLLDIEGIRRLVRKSLPSRAQYLPELNEDATETDAFAGYYALSQELYNYQNVMFFGEQLVISGPSGKVAIRYDSLCKIVVPLPKELPHVIIWGSRYWTVDKGLLTTSDGSTIEIVSAVSPEGYRTIYFWSQLMRLLNKGKTPSK